MTRRKPSILIVDDDHEVADTLAYIVGQGGYAVEIAYDGEWALHLANRNKFDVIFMDVLLPGMNGVECFIKLKGVCPKATVFMMTGYSSEQLAAQALKNGASDVLRKPVMPEDILAKIDRSSRNAVLVVDDDEEVRDSCCAMLRKSGWKCEAAEDGETALAMASAKTYGAMILDLKLPSMSGIDVFSQMRGAGVAIPTLVVTGYDRDYPHMTDPAVLGYLKKPADPRILLAMIERASEADL